MHATTICSSAGRATGDGQCWISITSTFWSCVAHSLGTALAVRRSQEKGAVTNAVAGAFLVAPSDIDRLATIPGYPALGFNPVIMERLSFPSVVLASRNDDRVAFELALAFASAWGSSFIDVGMQGHIGSAAKLGLWPQGLVWLGQFISSISCEAAAQTSSFLR